jgi:tRNA dimethylallyltransferase
VNTPKVILIAGPTASGKSALALELAERSGGVIVNADSMQVYRDLAVLTARPTATDQARAPHVLYGHVDARENYSVGRWLGDAALALGEAEAKGKLAAVVGGTGLYFKALTRGLSAIPPVPDDVRVKVRGETEALDTTALHARLAASDPLTAAKLRPSDRQRVLRALEVLAATGRPLAEWQQGGGNPLIPAGTPAVFLSVPREELHARIDARFDAMLKAGALDEVRALADRGLDWRLPVMKAHGVPWLQRYLADDISLADAVMRGKGDTRRYAKRQETFFRHQLPGWKWIEPEGALEYLLSVIPAEKARAAGD